MPILFHQVCIPASNTDYFEQLAARFGGDYDGWEASAD